MLLDFIRWLCGYVKFEVIGNFPERFFNIVTKNGLSIWNTHKKDDTLSACMYIKDYKNIRPLCRKSHVRLRLTKRCGLPFYIHGYRSRFGVLVGMIVFLLVVCVMSNFVWTINVSGLETISYNRLMDTLNKNGLYIGTYKPGVSFQTIGRDTMLEIEDIGWMSINVEGCHASVEIKEKAKSPKVYNYHQPANVKAEHDGLIISIDTMSGVSQFRAGSAVVKDQMLVSGVVEDSLGGVRLVRASAKVMAKTTHKESFAIEKSYSYYDFDNYKERVSYNIIGLDVPCSFAFADDSQCARRYSTSALKIYDTVLPLSKSSERLYKKSTNTLNMTYNKAQEIFKIKATLYECFNLSDCSVSERSINIVENADRFVCDVTYNCVEDIAYQQDINADNIKIERNLKKEDEKTQ